MINPVNTLNNLVSCFIITLFGLIHSFHILEVTLAKSKSTSFKLKREIKINQHFLLSTWRHSLQMHYYFLIFLNTVFQLSCKIKYICMYVYTQYAWCFDTYIQGRVLTSSCFILYYLTQLFISCLMTTFVINECRNFLVFDVLPLTVLSTIFSRAL